MLTWHIWIKTACTLTLTFNSHTRTVHAFHKVAQHLVYNDLLNNALLEFLVFSIEKKELKILAISPSTNKGNFVKYDGQGSTFPIFGFYIMKGTKFVLLTAHFQCFHSTILFFLFLFLFLLMLFDVRHFVCVFIHKLKNCVVFT